MKKEISATTAVPTNKCKCEVCGKIGLGGFHGFFIDGDVKYFCHDHKSYAPIKRGSWGIWDSQGKLRDRAWLDKKLNMTRSDKAWEEDIKSRRQVSPTEIGRFNGSKRVE